MKKMNVKVSRLLEYQAGLAMEEITKNVKIPVDKIQTMSELRIAITPALEAYDTAYKELLKRMSEQSVDVNGEPATVIPADKTIEFNEQHMTLKNKEYELSLPTFSIVDLGFNIKKPELNKYGIPAGFILALGELVTKKK